MKCAFLTMQDGQFQGDDDPELAKALSELGWSVEAVDWKRKDANWDAFGIALIRSPWDYHYQPQFFLEQLQAIERAGCRLIQRGELVQYNIDKRYLLELSDLFDFVIPTLLVERGSFNGESGSPEWFRILSRKLGYQIDEVVIKPTISAGSENTFRIPRGTRLDALTGVTNSLRERDMLVQPYLPTIGKTGEYSLVFLMGEYYHSIQKRPQAGDFRVQSQHGGIYQRVEPDPWLIEASRALLQIRVPNTTYARVDWVENPNTEAESPFLLMELELIEPDLYLRFTSSGVVYFAERLVTMCR